jgi:hypothetical protein
MLISEVRAELERIQAVYGDKSVFMMDETTGERVAFTIQPAIGARGQGTIVALVAAPDPSVMRREGWTWPTKTG